MPIEVHFTFLLIINRELTCLTVLSPCDCEALDEDAFEDFVLYFKKKTSLAPWWLCMIGMRYHFPN